MPTKRKSRKNTSDCNSEKKINKDELKEKLRQKKLEMEWARKSNFTRSQEFEKTEELLKNKEYSNGKKISKEERKKLKNKLKMLEEIEQKQFVNDNIGDFVDYSEQ